VITRRMFALTILFVAPRLFGQAGPTGFLGCYGYDPKGWAGEAGPGQCVVSSGQVVVAHGVYVHVDNPDCASGPNVFVDALVSGFKAGVSYGLSDYLGPAAPIVGDKLGDEFRKAIEGRLDPRAACQVVSVKLPARAKVVKATYWSWWDDHYSEQGEGAATGHWSKWEPPQVTDTPSGPVLWAIFKNWSDGVDQSAVIHVVYEPADMSREIRRQPDSLR